MTETCVLPVFSIDEAVRIVRDLFGIESTLQALNGERDLNYLVTSNLGRFVFKIANRDETYAMLECQHQVLELLVADKVMPQQASSVKSLNGKPIETITGEDSIDYFCRMLHYVEGDLLSSVTPHSPELMNDFGTILARLDGSLRNFSHLALQRPLLWNMCDALATLDRFKPLLASDQKRSLIKHFEVHFQTTVLPVSLELRRGVIHNDANDNNVLVSGGPQRDQYVNSIIDFGDMVNTWIVVEPAVAAAYAMMGKDKPLDTATAIIKGYNKHMPLRKNEIRVLFDFICMRLCMSVCICAYQRSIEPDNEYLGISERPAWTLLEKLSNISHKAVYQLFLEACD